MQPEERRESIFGTGACSPFISMSEIKQWRGHLHDPHIPTMAPHSSSSPLPFSCLSPVERSKAEAPNGFTLIELLIVVTILAILAAIAYPSYRTQVENTRRAEMQSELMSLTEYLERKHAELGCYNFAHDATTRTCDTTGTPIAVPFESTNSYYDVTFVDGTLTASTYVLQATPKGSQANNGALSIDQAQRRHWDENNDGDMDDTGENNWKRG